MGVVAVRVDIVPIAQLDELVDVTRIDDLLVALIDVEIGIVRWRNELVILVQLGEQTEYAELTLAAARGLEPPIPVRIVAAPSIRMNRRHRQTLRDDERVAPLQPVTELNEWMDYASRRRPKPHLPIADVRLLRQCVPPDRRRHAIRIDLRREELEVGCIRCRR